MIMNNQDKCKCNYYLLDAWTFLHSRIFHRETQISLPSNRTTQGIHGGTSNSTFHRLQHASWIGQESKERKRDPWPWFLPCHGFFSNPKSQRYLRAKAPSRWQKHLASCFRPEDKGQEIEERSVMSERAGNVKKKGFIATHLVHVSGSVIKDTKHRDKAVWASIGSGDVSSLRSNAVDIQPNATGWFWNQGRLLQGIVDSWKKSYCSWLHCLSESLSSAILYLQ